MVRIEPFPMPSSIAITIVGRLYVFAMRAVMIGIIPGCHFSEESTMAF